MARTFIPGAGAELRNKKLLSCIGDTMFKNSSPTSARIRFLLGPLFSLLLIGALCAGSIAVRAEDDPPGRVGQISDLQGQAWLFDVERWEWLPAERNRPLTTGDRLAIAPGGRAVVRIGSTTVRLDGGSELEMRQLDDQRIVLVLHNGTIALKVTSSEVAAETELTTPEARFQPRQPGHYRLDRRDGKIHATTWNGELGVVGPDFGVLIGKGQRIELRQELSSVVRSAMLASERDAFFDWVARDVQGEPRSVAAQYVSPEMTGWEDLDRYGNWESNPDYGALWVPSAVAADWAPYRKGRWAWVRPWGWTWMDEAPWGFAPFHYGRWTMVGGRWAWSPGQRVQRPVYAPALVTWTNGSSVNLSVRIGSAPTGGWAPLAPREPYRPHYRSSATHERNLNLPHLHGSPRTGPENERWERIRSTRPRSEARGAPSGGSDHPRQSAAPPAAVNMPVLPSPVPATVPTPRERREEQRERGASRHSRSSAPPPASTPSVVTPLPASATPPAPGRSADPSGAAVVSPRQKSREGRGEDREDRSKAREGRRSGRETER